MTKPQQIDEQDIKNVNFLISIDIGFAARKGFSTNTRVASTGLKENANTAESPEGPPRNNEIPRRRDLETMSDG